MAIDFGKLKTDLVSAGKEVGGKVTEASNVAKLKLDIRAKEDFMEKQFAELGKAYFEAHKDDEEVPEKDYFASIVEAQTQIDALKDELMDVQGAVTCPQCGVKQAKGSSFCANCGASLLD